MSIFPPPSLQPPARKAPVGRRVKPARGAKIAAVTLSTASTLGLAALFAKQDDVPTTVAVTPSPGATTSATIAFETESATDETTAETTAGTTAATTGGGTETTTATAPAAIADGVFVGVPDTNRWGTVQVQIVVSGGLLTDVEVLSYPDDDRKSVRINERALPTLTAEALAAQDANIDSVSGATYTWQSYTISLQSALDAATSAA
ncbi:MAG: FMN-binding protein [Actinomycetia bacterium]|nr:FMN-binding protein [Actinomycetes bacterium]